jgi:hypothetical protein
MEINKLIDVMFLETCLALSKIFIGSEYWHCCGDLMRGVRGLHHSPG